MFGELVPQGGGDPIPLLKTKLLVGRRDSCDIALRFPNVSSRHCELELRNGYWLIRDLSSSNGTKVNGVRVRARWILPGDEVAVAKHRFTIDYNVAPDIPPPPPLPEEEDMGQSLLEKAGLVRRRAVEDPVPPPARNATTRPRPAQPPSTDDDRALEWLQDDNDSA